MQRHETASLTSSTVIICLALSSLLFLETGNSHSGPRLGCTIQYIEAHFMQVSQRSVAILLGVSFFGTHLALT